MCVVAFFLLWGLLSGLVWDFYTFIPLHILYLYSVIALSLYISPAFIHIPSVYFSAPSQAAPTQKKKEEKRKCPNRGHHYATAQRRPRLRVRFFFFFFFWQLHQH